MEGLYRYRRLCIQYCMHRSVPAPSTFQKWVDNLVVGISCVATYLDDVIVIGQMQAEHIAKPWRFLNIFDNYDQNMQMGHCVLFAAEVSSLCTSSRRTDCVRMIRGPSDIRVCMCACVYLFAPYQPATIVAVQGHTTEVVSRMHRRHRPIQAMLPDKTRLVHYASENVLATYTSPYGIGAVIVDVLYDCIIIT